MGEVLSIFTQDNSESLSDYNYIVFKGIPQESCFFLSPDVMKIDDDLFVVGMNSAKRYWENYAESLSLKPLDIVKKTLENNLGNYVACLCHHPYQGMLFLNFLLFRQMNGLHSFNSRFSKTNYNRLEWRTWYFTSKQLESCFHNYKLLIKERKNFATNLSKFERFANRVGLDSTKSLKDVLPDDMGRRFGLFIQLLWRWSNSDYTEIEKNNNYIDIFSDLIMPHLDEFPWVSHKDPFKAFVVNSLEYPISTWPQVEPYLKEDLTNLTKKIQTQKRLRILQLSWKLTTYDGNNIETFIDFKFPVCLQSQKGSGFRSVILQFEYAFDDFQKAWKEEIEDTDLPNCQVILGWKIEIVKKIDSSVENTQLMGRDAIAFREDVEELQNKLKTEIKSFITQRHSVPCLDHSVQEGLGKSVSPLYERIYIKPMFVYPEPLEIEASEIKEKEFLERTSSDWWNHFDPHDSYRDYFICLLQDEKYYWVFKNSRDKWFKHGIYS